MDPDPFQQALAELRAISIDKVKEKIASAHYGPPDSWKMRAAEYLIREHEAFQQSEKFKKDFDLTKQNVEATKEMARQTRSLAVATWILAFATIILVILTCVKNGIKVLNNSLDSRDINRFDIGK